MRSFTLFAAAVALLAAVLLLPQGSVAPPNLIEIQAESNFHEWTKSKDRSTLVYFYAHWSPICKAFTREYKDVAKYFGRAGYENEIMVTKMDGPNFSKLSRSLKIEAFPTLLLYSHVEPGKAEKYEGELEKEAVIKWVEARLHPKMASAGKTIPEKPLKRRLA